MIIKKMFRALYVGCLFLFLALSIFPLKAYSQSMSTYCAAPPFLISSVTPNVLFIVDNSGSMKYAAYWPQGLHLYEVDTSFDPSYKYYGIFDPDSQYFYNDSDDYFYKDSNGDWNGNFLNWLTMRRYDILLKILVGGNYKKSGSDEFLQGFNTIEKNADSLYPYGYKFKKKYEESESDNYFPYDYSDEIFYVGIDYDGSNKTRNDRFWFEVDGDKYAIRVKIDGKPKGILQKISKKIRVGLMVFNHGSEYEDDDDRKDGGRVVSYISDNNTNLASLYLNQDVYDKNKYPNKPKGYPPLYPHNWTPLAETYYEAIRYFEATQSAYNSGVDYSNHDPIQYRCQKNFVILITDGESTKDMNVPGTCFYGYTGTVSDPNFNVKTWMDKIADEEGYDSKWCSTLSSDGTYYLEGDAYYSHVSDLRSNLPGTQNLTLYTIYTFGRSARARKLLEAAAKYGGFKDLNGDGKPDLQAEWDKNGDGIPDNYLGARDGYLIENFIQGTINEILKRVSSSTAASVVSANEKSGANILQALFWPKRSFDNASSDNNSITWSGTLYNLWMYMGPFSSSQEIRENSDTTGESSSVKNLTLKDKVIQFYSDSGETKIKICDDIKGNGQLTNCTFNNSLSDLKTVWNAGKQLWETSPDERKIFTDIENLSDNLAEGNFIDIDNNSEELQNYLDVDNLTQAQDIIKWARGVNVSNLRSRVFPINSQYHVWKLGDIINSTPKVVSVNPINSYYKKYNDITYYKFNYNKDGSFKHNNRGMVFVGSNDGMLHAFRLGALSFPGGDILAQLKENGGPFGSEAWAFIPKNVLPYLKYIAQKNYCHIYSVDLTPYIFDASIGDPTDTNSYGQPDDNKTELSWRTILIGGLNLGGASGNGADGSVHPPNDTGKVPSGIGRSSYFALDVTDTENPKVLWEFSDNDTAFTTTGPAIIHIPAKKRLDNGTYVDDTSKNGYWYVAFASGPDNYNGTVHQPLYLYILDLKTGILKRKIQLSGSSCTLSGNNCQNNLIGDYNAFAGRMFDSSVDLGANYSDDGFYFGYTYNSGGVWKGGVVRVNTLDDSNVNDWQTSLLIKDIGPVTAAVRSLEDISDHKLWLYFGGGRYFTREDDPSAQRRIYGVEDPCYSDSKLTDGCSTTLTLNELDNVTKNISDNSTTLKGWYIDLTPYKTVIDNVTYNSERLIADPIVFDNGWVFYTTFMPTNDICSYGGGTYIWAVNYNNGGAINNIYGKIFLQTTTGRVNEINLSPPTSDNNPPHRKIGSGGGPGGGPIHPPIKGKGEGGTITLHPKPLNKTIQWLED